VYIDVAPAQPAILPSGDQAMMQDASGHLIGPANPAHAGDTVVLYTAGLGAVDPKVDDGTITPPDSPSTVRNPVAVTIGGQSVANPSANLAPGLAGVYQIVLTVPQGVTPGDQVPVVVTAAGQTSPALGTSVR
jgi:uncharacterized protein (TIGR03437 family)